MNYIIINTEALAQLNTRRRRKLTPVETLSGHWVLPVDVLYDPVTWGFAIEYLKGCELVQLTDDDFYKPEIDFNNL